MKMDEPIWPRASESDKEWGWTLDKPFLKVIRAICRANGEEVSSEQVEQVLLAAEAHAILAKLPKHTCP